MSVPGPQDSGLPQRPVLPRYCGTCGSPDVTPHCRNPLCTWVSCLECRKITDRRRLPREDRA
jgi:hypothetical protein